MKLKLKPKPTQDPYDDPRSLVNYLDRELTRDRDLRVIELSKASIEKLEQEISLLQRLWKPLGGGWVNGKKLNYRGIPIKELVCRAETKKTIRIKLSSKPIAAVSRKR
jgi:hypothetical protein